MTQYLYDRVAKLRVFENEVTTRDDGSLNLIKTNPIGVEFPSQYEDGRAGYRITFSIDKIVEPTPNQTSIYIYNLSENSRSIVEKRNSTLFLEAGYKGLVENIFTGNISRTRTEKSGVDYITHIECADGLFQYANSRIDASFNAGVNLKDVVKTLTESFGLSKGSQEGIPEKKLQSPLTFSGMSRNHLTEVLGQEGLDWSIQDGSIIILPKGSTLGVEAVQLSVDSGLIGIPKKKDIGIEFDSLLNSKIKPFSIVYLKSKFITGAFRCLKVIHSGDTFSGEWKTSVEASEIL